VPTLTKSIILEGPNGAGKSTLANQLAEKYMMPIVHATKPDGPFDAIEKAFRQSFSTVPVIYDRSHAVSRLVYQYDTIGDLECDILVACARHLSSDYTIIYCVGQGDRDMDKPHYTEELKEATKDQNIIRQKYDYIMRDLNYQKYDFAKDEIGSLQLT